MTIAIIGAGPLGRWLALAAARAGYRVLLEDVMPANLHHAQEYLRHELAVQAAEDKSLIKVEFVSTIEDAVREADLAIDCVPDELESKLEILWLLDRMAQPRMVIATPTTHLAVDDLANCTYRPDRCVALSIDPRRFAKLREADSNAATEMLVRTTPRTTPEAIGLVKEFWERLGWRVAVEAST